MRLLKPDDKTIVVPAPKAEKSAAVLEKTIAPKEEKAAAAVPADSASKKAPEVNQEKEDLKKAMNELEDKVKSVMSAKKKAQEQYKEAEKLDQ